MFFCYMNQINDDPDLHAVHWYDLIERYMPVYNL